MAPPLRSPEFMIEFGIRLRARRNQLGLSLLTLGRRIGVSPQQLNKYEIGQNEPHVSTAATLARALDTTVAELCGEVPKRSPLTSAETKVIAAVRHIRPRQKAVVLHLLDQLANAVDSAS